MGKHPSHVTRFSDSSFYDERCINCDATDMVPGGWGELAKPCPQPVGQGGLTYEEWLNGPEKERLERIEKSRNEFKSRT